MTAVPIMLVLFWTLGYCSTVASFAYAPNFITKIIEEQTGIVPTIDSFGSNNQHDIVAADKDTTTIAVATQTVRTRFPPEPNGYLHLGHAKAVSFNFAVARMFGGKCNMRLDDTNPSKEDREYVDSILADVKWIQSGLYPNKDFPWDDKVCKTSDYFDVIYDCAVALIKSGDAYVDSLSASDMREYRGTLTEPGKDSPYRTRSIDENLQMFTAMKNGEYADGEHVLRAKIDMASPNINMRDPTLYRIKHESHQETGDTWCIYPMYDFSHPIADAVERITHSLCTLEFEDHRPFYDWTIDKLLHTGLIPDDTRPQQIEFSRLNIQSTVLSKRKLIQLVQEKHVSGWNDPRMPTLSGIRRRGVPPQALRLFCERVGISKVDSNIDYTNLEDCIRECMDDTCPRAFGVLDPLKVTITNWDRDLEDFNVDRHPKLPDMGIRTIQFGKTIYIERDDFFDTANGEVPPKGYKRLTESQKVRLRYAYVIECEKVIRDPETNMPIELQCKYYPDSRAGATPSGMDRVKGIIHWVEESTAVPCQVNLYDRLFTSEEPGKESGDFLKDINPDSLVTLQNSLLEPSVALDAKKLLSDLVQANGNAQSDSKYPGLLAYQFERNGYFALDESSTSDKLVMNRVATLRDTWQATKIDNSQKQDSQQQQSSRNNSSNSSNNNKQSSEPAEDILRIALRAGKVLSVDNHPDSDKLLICKVDCGDDEPRTVVAGLAGKVDDNIVGKVLVLATNLKPAKLGGIESTAMILAASDKDSVVELLELASDTKIGSLVQFDGKPPSEPDAMMKSKGAIKAFERAKAGLRVTSDGYAAYVSDNDETHVMLTESGDKIKVASLTNVPIQ